MPVPGGNWTNNTIMTWAGIKVSDHGRTALVQANENIATDKRMANGTLRRQFIRTKRTWSCSWENIPSSNVTPAGLPAGFGLIKTVDGGMSGEEMEAFWKANPGKFRLVVRRGKASGIAVPNPAESALPYEDTNFYIANVMITDFSKEVRKRGYVDLWAVNVSLEEV